MKVAHVYCSHCGYESFDDTVSLGGRYSNGLFVLCPNCGEETSDFDDVGEYEDEDEVKKETA